MQPLPTTSLPLLPHPDHTLARLLSSLQVLEGRVEALPSRYSRDLQRLVALMLVQEPAQVCEGVSAWCECMVCWASCWSRIRAGAWRRCECIGGCLVGGGVGVWLRCCVNLAWRRARAPPLNAYKLLLLPLLPCSDLPSARACRLIGPSYFNLPLLLAVPARYSPFRHSLPAPALQRPTVDPQDALGTLHVAPAVPAPSPSAVCSSSPNPSTDTHQLRDPRQTLGALQTPVPASSPAGCDSPTLLYRDPQSTKS